MPGVFQIVLRNLISEVTHLHRDNGTTRQLALKCGRVIDLGGWHTAGSSDWVHVVLDNIMYVG